MNVDLIEIETSGIAQVELDNLGQIRIEHFIRSSILPNPCAVAIFAKEENKKEVHIVE